MPPQRPNGKKPVSSAPAVISVGRAIDSLEEHAAAVRWSDPGGRVALQEDAIWPLLEASFERHQSFGQPPARL